MWRRENGRYMKWFRAFSYLLLVVFVVPSATALAGERVAVAKKIANVRALPSTKSDTLWQVEKFHPLQIIEKKGKWYRFKDFEGDSGWIHSSLVDKTSSVIIRVRRANIRIGPGTQYDLAFDADKGTPFKVLETKGRWKKVQHADGDIGWIFSTLVW